MTTIRPTATIALSDIAVLSAASAVFLKPTWLGIAFVATTTTLLLLSGAYRPRISYRLSTQFFPLLVSLTVSALLVATWPSPHRLGIVRHLPAMAVTFLLGRLVTFWLVHWTRVHSKVAAHALVVGTGQASQRVAASLLRHRECGIVPVGYVDTAEQAEQPRAAPDAGPDLPVVADVAHVGHAVEALGVRHLIVVSGAEPDGLLCRSLWQCQSLGVEVWAVAGLLGRAADPCRGFGEHLWGLNFEHLRRPGQQTAARFVKRAFDAAVALVLVLLTAPLLLLLAVAVRLSSPGPVFFRQRRVGQDGREFELLKFRSMLVNNDSDTRWNVSDDGRVTPVGRILRATSLDELPQMLNVLRGDMSLVGPRPERPHFHQLFAHTVDRYPERLRAPVGITGWAQVHGLRGDTSIDDRTRFDNYYIEHWSLWLDVVILMRTGGALIKWMLATGAAAAAISAADPRSEVAPADCQTAPVAVPANVATNQP